MNSDIYRKVTNFLKKRTIELMGLFLISIALLLAISFFSYSPNDPTFVYGPENTMINNLLGVYGALVADFLLQSFGLVSFLILITIISWGVNLIVKKEIKKIQFRIFYLILYLIFTCTLVYVTFNNSFWLIDNGNSGFIGQILYDWFSSIFPALNHEYTVFFLIVSSFLFFILASNIHFKYFLFFIKGILKLFKKKNSTTNQFSSIKEETKDLITDSHLSDTTQQTFPFEKIIPFILSISLT